MILSNEDIRKALKDGAVEIDPAPAGHQYTTSAVDLTLAGDFRIWESKSLTAKGAKVEIDLAEWSFADLAKGYLKKAPTDADGCLVMPPYREHPWHFLAQTREKIHLKTKHRIAARVEGRSSLARIGLMVHLTAPIIHCGFWGHIALEMVNFGPFHLKLRPANTKICQLVFEKLESPPTGGPATAFQGQRTPAGDSG